MRRKILSAAVIWLVVSLGFLAITSSFAVEETIAYDGNDGGDGNELNLTLLEKGDVVLVGGGKYDNKVPGRWTHALMYIGDGKVIESVAEGVVIKDVERIHRDDKAAIFRVDTSEEVKNEAVEFAMDKEGTPFDFVWPTKKIDGSAYYCSELVWASYKTQGVDIDQNPGWTWKYMNGVAPTEIADDDDTTRIAMDE